jgi:hypothetical protein
MRCGGEDERRREVQAEKQRFVRLIAKGFGNSEACRLVGITAGRGRGGGPAARY